MLYCDDDGRFGEGVGGTPEAVTRFGFALALAELDCDDYTDLVGSP